MAGIITLVGALIQLAIKVLDIIRERDEAKRKAKQEAVNVIKEGIAERDASKLTIGFDKFNRVL